MDEQPFTKKVMSDYSSNNKRIVKNTIFLTIRMIIVLCVNLFTTRIVLKALGVEDFGIYSVVGGLVAMFTFINSSMTNGIQRFYNFELGKNGIIGANKVYITSIQIQLLIGGLIVLLTETIGLWYLNEQMVLPTYRIEASNWLFQASIVSFLVSFLQVPFMASFVAHEKMNFYAVISIIDVSLRLLIAFAIIYIPGDHLITYGILLMCVAFIDLSVYYFCSRLKFEEIRFKRFFDKELFKSMLSFSSWNAFGSFTAMMKDQGVNMVINIFFGPVVNAARGISYQIMSGLNGFSANISMTTRPQIVKSFAQGDVKRTIWLFFLSSKLCFMAIFLFALPIIIEINYVLSIWLGNNVPKYADIFTIWVLFTAFINNLNGPTSGVVHATGKMKKYQLVNSLVSIIIVPLTFLAYKTGASPEAGFIIVFIMTTIGQIISLFILRTLVNFSIRCYFKEVVWALFTVIVLSFSVSFIPHYFMPEGILRLIVVSAIAIISQLIFFMYFGINRAERLSVIKTINAKITKSKTMFKIQR